MRLATLGSEGPDISRVGYGAWEAGGMAWGENPPDERTIAAMRAGFDAGINWVDTAEVYGGGRSEELVGEALQGFPDVMVFTKVAPAPSGSGFSPEGVRAGCHGSLKRLGRDRIDLFQLHWPSGDVPIEDTWGAMAELMDDGLVRWVGLSNFPRPMIESCEAIRHVDSLQPQFSLMSQNGRHDLFPFCKSNGTGILCYGPLAYGLLTGAIDADTTFHEDDWRGGDHGMDHYYNELFAPEVFPRRLRQVKALKPIAQLLGIELAQLALAWVLRQTGVTGAIAGSRSPEHVAVNAGASEVELSDPDLKAVDAIFD